MILLISETLDPATPYSGSLEVRRLFPSASLIEGVGGTTHSGSLSGVDCTDDAIGAYLEDEVGGLPYAPDAGGAWRGSGSTEPAEGVTVTYSYAIAPLVS